MRLRLPVARLASVLLFAAVCAIAAGWALQLFAPRAPIAPGGAVAQAQPPVDLSAAGGLFGGVPQPVQAVAPPSNVQVAGVLAAGSRSVALIGIDGRPAKPFAVGEQVADGLRLRSVTGDTVELERAGQPVRLPAPPKASLEVLTRGPQGGAATTAPPPSAPLGTRGGPTFAAPPPPPPEQQAMPMPIPGQPTVIGGAVPPMMTAPGFQTPEPQPGNQNGAPP